MTKLDRLAALQKLLSENRRETICKVAAQRTRYITVVMEDIYQPQNASAVLRTCDCFGIQDVYIIENRNQYQINPIVTRGSDKWLTINKFSDRANNTSEAIQHIRKKGYRVVATLPGDKAISPLNYDLSRGKTALFFGTELKGLTQEVINNADDMVQIPMVGFSQSLNLSVSAAIILFNLTNTLRLSELPWQLSDDELLDLKLEWLRKNIHKDRKID